MKTRILSGLLMAPLLEVLYFGGVALWAAALLIYEAVRQRSSL